MTDVQNYENGLLLIKEYLNTDWGWFEEINNEIFEMRPYSESVYEEYDNEEYGNEEDIPANFYHKESGLKIWWYKHIGRGMESNIPYNEIKDQWYKIVYEVIDYLENNK